MMENVKGLTFLATRRHLHSDEVQFITAAMLPVDGASWRARAADERGARDRFRSLSRLGTHKRFGDERAVHPVEAARTRGCRNPASLPRSTGSRM